MNTEQLKITVAGLDLGSAYAKIAAVDKGTVDIITNQANLRQTPALVAYGPNERLLGENAQAKLKSNYANSIAAPHRYLGFAQSEYVKQESIFAPCKPKQENGVLLFGVSQQERKEKLSAEQMSAALVTKINQILEMNKMNNKFLVVAVPDYLTYHERKAWLNMLYIAKESSQINYGIQLINESAAIGLDYGFYKKKDFKDKEEDAQVTLFVDFGHSKLSVYAIKFTQKYQKVILQHHRRQLGCRNLDSLMYQFYSTMFQSQNQDLQIRVSEGKKAILKLLQNIEKQRKVLSGNSQYDFNIECLIEERDLCYTMTRNQFEQISQPALEQIVSFFEEVKMQLAQMGVSPTHIELVGGGSRIPCFIKTVANVFGLEPSRTLNSSECIARGAALFSAMQSSLFRTQPYYSVELSPYQLRCSCRGEDQTMQIEENNTVLLQRTQTFFSEKQIQLVLKTSNQRVFFQINQSSLPSGLQTKICSFYIDFEGSNQELTDKKVKLTLKFDDNKILNGVTMSKSKEKDETLKLSQLKFVEKISNQKLKEFVAKEKRDIAKDQRIIRNYQQKNNFESQIFALKQNLAAIADSKTLKDYIRPERVEEVFKFFTDLENNFQNVVNFPQEIKKAQSIVNQFETEVESAKNKYLKVEQELKKFNEHIEAIVNGRVKQVKFYPPEEINKMKNWIATTLAQLKKQPKNRQLCTSVEQISNMWKFLMEKIEQCQSEELRRQKQEEKRHYQTRQQQNRHFYRDPYQSSPFGGHYGYQAPRARGRGRNSSFGGYNPFGFF